MRTLEKVVFLMLSIFFLLSLSKSEVEQSKQENEKPFDPLDFGVDEENKQIDDLKERLKNKDINEVRQILKDFMSINNLDKVVLGDAASDDEDTRIPCEGKPHSVIDESDNKTCVCRKGYVGDNPVTSRGCWTCRNQCNKNFAACKYPGVCECINGYVGDGVDCEAPAPKIEKISSIDKGIIVYIVKDPSNFTMTEGYCRFGVPIVKAEIIGATMHCQIPEDAGKYVSVSYDKKTWSDSTMYAEKEEDDKIQKKHKAFVKKLSIIGGVTVVALIIFALIGLKRGKETTTDIAEHEVLYKNGHRRTKSSRRKTPQSLV